MGYLLVICLKWTAGKEQASPIPLNGLLCDVSWVHSSLMHAKWGVVPTSCKLAGLFPSKSLDSSDQALHAGLKRAAMTTAVGPEAALSIQNS